MKKYLLRRDDRDGQDAAGFNAYLKRPWLWLWGPFFTGFEWEPVSEHYVYGPKIVWLTKSERRAFRRGHNFLTREEPKHAHRG